MMLVVNRIKPIAKPTNRRIDRKIYLQSTTTGLSVF